MNFLVENMGNLFVILILVVCCTFAILSIIKDKKNGKSSCGGSCSGCGASGSCHQPLNKNTLLKAYRKDHPTSCH